MFDLNQFYLTIEQKESRCRQICRMNSAGKLKFFCKLLFSVFYARKNSTEMCVTDFWTVVFVLFRYKSSRVKLEEYEISSRTQLTFEERESERKLDKEKEEEIEEYIWNITRNKSLHVSAASAEHSLSFGRVQPLSKNVPWFCRFCKRHLTAIDQPATTFTEMAYTKLI